MLKRALFFSTPFCLSLRDNQLVIATKEAPNLRKSVPIEDIGVVVLEHQQTTVTLPLLNALSDRNVAVVFCDGNRMPNAMLMNLDSNRTQGESYRAQIEADRRSENPQPGRPAAQAGQRRRQTETLLQERQERRCG